MANWLYAAALAALIIAMLAAPGWTFEALGVDPDASKALSRGMLAIAILGLLAVPANAAILARLRAMVDSISGGSAFEPENAARLRTIAWALLGLQLLQLVIGLIAEGVSTPEHPLDIETISFAGWLAVLAAFVLSGVFAEGARMREDLAGTV